mmetsp:Transcript_80795/g.130959  ORF Transcript_80795/g.130959 Transcript_80795/m.130959 type:complete len:90 (+) Transcript_80795:51-320(+)
MWCATPGLRGELFSSPPICDLMSHQTRIYACGWRYSTDNAFRLSFSLMYLLFTDVIPAKLLHSYRRRAMSGIVISTLLSMCRFKGFTVL